MTGAAIQQIFNLPAVWSYIVAASIEVAGFGINAYYLEAQAFNEAELAHMERYHAKTLRLPLEDIGGARKAKNGFYIVTGCIVAFNAIYQVAAKGADAIVLLACLFPVASAIATSAANKRAALHRKIVRSREPAANVAETSRERDETVTQPRESAPIEPPRRIDIAEWRELAAGLNGNRAGMDAAGVNALLESRGLATIPPSTARGWARVAREMEP